MSKNIIIFSTAYFPFVGGAEVAVKEITDRIGGEFNFHLITNRVSKKLSKKEQIGNALVFRVGVPYWNNDAFARRFSNSAYILFAFFKAVRLNFSFHYEIIWPIMASYAGVSALFFNFFFPGKKFLLTLQEGDDPNYILKRVSIFYPLWRAIFIFSDRIQAISHFLKDFAVKNGANPSKITVVPNGVDAAKNQKSIRQPADKNQKLKDNLNIKDDEKIVITASRLVYKNGIDVLIEAIGKIISDGKELKIKLIVLGDGEERENLEIKIKNLGLENQVILLGSVPPEEVYDYLAISDLFVRPSRSEGLGNSFLEAMAMGVPVIGTKVGGIPDFLRDNETGIFCEVDDYKDLAEKIKFLFDNSELRDRLAKNAKRLIEDKYDWNLISREMEKIFKQILSV